MMRPSGARLGLRKGPHDVASNRVAPLGIPRGLRGRWMPKFTLPPSDWVGRSDSPQRNNKNRVSQRRRVSRGCDRASISFVRNDRSLFPSKNLFISVPVFPCAQTGLTSRLRLNPSGVLRNIEAFPWSTLWSRAAKLFCRQQYLSSVSAYRPHGLSCSLTHLSDW